MRTAPSTRWAKVTSPREHYFGIKQQLFVTAVRLPFQPAEVVNQLVGGDRGTAGERLVR